MSLLKEDFCTRLLGAGIFALSSHLEDYKDR